MMGLRGILLCALISVIGSAEAAPKSDPQKSEPVRHWILRGSENEIQALARENGLKIKHLFAPNERKLLQKAGKSALANTRVLTLSGESEAGYLRGVIRKRRMAVSLQPDVILRTKKVSRISAVPGKPDPLSMEQWALKNTGKTHREFVDDFRSQYIQGVTGEDVHLPARSKEGEGIVVAILDSGVDLTHPDLKNQIAYKPGECKALEAYEKCVDEKGPRACVALKNVDTDGNGYPMDCHGWNMTGDEDPETGVIGDQEMLDPEDIAHGSHVAGIIAAEASNGIGVRGIAPKSKILPVRVMNTQVGEGDGAVANEDDAVTLISTVVRGILYSVSSKANIINMSLAWDRRADSLVQAPPPEGEAAGPQKSLMEEAIDYARSEGVLVIASAGNDSTDALGYPCQHSGILCVAAHAADGKIAAFSNYGSGVDVAAPGHDILSTMPMDYRPQIFTDFPGYDFLNGTSMSAPYAAGAAAILMSEGYSADETFARLIVGARQRPFVDRKLVLSGNLDVANAMNVIPRPWIAPSVKGVTYAVWDPRKKSFRLKFRLKNIWAAAPAMSLELRSGDTPLLSSFYRLKQTHFDLKSWAPGEEKTFELDVEVLDQRLSSEILLHVVVKGSKGHPQMIRVPFIVSTVVTREAAHPNALTVPVRSGTQMPNSVMYSINTLDGRPGSDFVAVTANQNGWKFQLVREEKDGYVFGAVRSLPPLRNGGLRNPTRMDVNLDGKSDYVLVFIRDGDRPKPSADGKPARAPVYYDIYYVDENGEDVLPMFTYKNQVTDMNLDHLQWMKMGNRLVQTWVRVGTTPALEKPAYTPWDPNPTDYPEQRIYYHDPAATEDGLRSVPVPKGYFIEALFNQSTTDRQNGELLTLLTDSRKFTTRYYVAEIREGRFGTPVELRLPEYRNLSRLESLKVLSLYGDDVSTLSLVGGSGVNDQRITTLVRSSSGVSVHDQTVLPNDSYDFAYKVMGSFHDSSGNAGDGIASFTQAEYSFLYRDSTLSAPIETSLRRYTFLGSMMFARLFYPMVAESQGERLPALFIADGFGAYLGAELIVPVRDRAGKTVELTRPAYLRFLNMDQSCEWLNPRPVTRTSPSEAVYFCGDRFVRIPYRF